MTSSMPEEQPVSSGGFRIGCIGRLVVVAVAALVIITLLSVIFGEGSGSSSPSSGNGSDTYNGGPVDNFPVADVSQVEADHLWIVRLPDGEFRAFYDKSARQQELDGDCRIFFDERAGIGTLEPLEGMTGAFVEDCNDRRSVWRADGVFAFGSAYGNLDRFDTRINDEGELVVDLTRRTCTRSRGVPGIPPFEERVCRGRPG
jgi:hypothetical protein